MRLLLDTHTFLWYIAGSSNLSSSVKELVEDVRTELLLSMASAWEMAIKAGQGKLDLDEPLATLLPRELERNRVDLVNIELSHVLLVETLPFHHKDPFDRLIIAQALV